MDADNNSRDNLAAPMNSARALDPRKTTQLPEKSMNTKLRPIARPNVRSEQKKLLQALTHRGLTDAEVLDAVEVTRPHLLTRAVQAGNHRLKAWVIIREKPDKAAWRGFREISFAVLPREGETFEADNRFFRVERIVHPTRPAPCVCDIYALALGSKLES